MAVQKKVSYGMEKRMNRLMTILGLLRANARGESSVEWTAGRLAEECGCTERTVRRTLDDLREDPYWAKIEYDTIRRSYVLKEQPEQMPVAPLSIETLRKLVVASVVLRESQTAVLGNWVGAAVDEVFRQGGDSAESLRRRIHDAFLVKPLGVGRADTGFFSLLLEAILHSKELRIRYWTGHARTRLTVRVRPHLLVQSDGMWYLYATRVDADVSQNKLRMYSLPRIRRVRFLQTTFEQPNAEVLKRRFKNRIGIIDDEPNAAQSVRFEARGWAMRLIDERYWGRILRRVSHTKVSATYELMLSRPEEFERWLLSFGADVRVLAPPSLVERIRKAHLDAAMGAGWGG